MLWRHASFWGFLLLSATLPAQVRVATYNVTNYNGGRVADLQNAIFGEFEGRSMRPDIIATQEFLSVTANGAFLEMLNTAPNRGGPWAAAPFINGPDTDSALFYRSDKFDLVSVVTVSAGGAAPNPPRDTRRYDLVLKGFTRIQPKIAVYSAHFKAGDTSADEARRLVEAQRIRTDAQNLDASYWGFVLGGDLNVYRSTDDSFEQLTLSQSNNLGRFFDPAQRSGSWNNNSTYRFLHTQDPIGDGGMDSRFDFVLLSGSLYDGIGMDYVGPLFTGYGFSNWDEAGHSYRAWGNDGSSFNTTLRTTGNTMVGPSIAQSLINAAAGAGHLPVFLDLRAPAEMGSTTASLNFGRVIQGSLVSLPLNVSHTTSTLWGSQIANLPWQAQAFQGFSVSPASGTLNPFSSASTIVTAPTTNVGVRNGSVLLSSSDPRVNTLSIPATIEVVPNYFSPNALMVRTGLNVAGGLFSLEASDDQVLSANATYLVSRSHPNVGFELTATSPLDQVGQMSVRIEGRTSPAGMPFEMQLLNRNTQVWDRIASGTGSTTDTVATYAVPQPNQYLEPLSGRVRARLNYGVLLTGGRTQRVSIDEVRFLIGN